MLYKLVFMLWLFSTVSGFVLTSYGVLRESFADLAQPRGFGEGRYGEGTYGGGPTGLQEFLVNLGIKTGLLPGDQALTVTDKKNNAAAAVAGVVLLGLSILFDLWLKYLSRSG